MKHYRLLNDLAALEQQLTQMVKGASGFSVEQAHATWSPPVDIYETPAGFVLTAEVPGMPKPMLGNEDALLPTFKR